MFYFYINDTDRTSSIIRDTLSITEELQRRSAVANFYMSANRPTEGQEIKIYESVTLNTAITGGTTTDIIIDLDTISGESIYDTYLFRKGETIYIGVGTANEETAVISSINTTTNTIVATANVANSHSVGAKIGKKIFAGTIESTRDNNITTLTNLEFYVTATDYQHLFDRKLINESYEDRTALYIINDFLNESVNYNFLLEDFEYANNTALRAEWVETGDGNDPTLDTTNYKEGDKACILDWTNAGGTATFTASPTGQDVSDTTGATSGAPTSGVLAFWYKCDDYTKVTNFVVRIGSDSSNYAQITVTPTDNVFTYERQDLDNSSVTGTPDWTDVDYIAIIVTETDDSNIIFDGIRINETGSFTFDNVDEGDEYDNFNIGYRKPTYVMQLIADTQNKWWYIDYDKDIHLFDFTANSSPFSLNGTTDNFNNLSVEPDISNLINQQVVRGASQVSDATYSQVIEGNLIVREWIMKNKFKNLVVSLDDNSSTDTCEAGTTTTNITATSHGLVTGDYITNRTRSNAVRKITYVDDDNFTVEAVTAQTNGDTISLFVAQTVGIENIDDETSYDYVSNFNEKSIRATSVTDTLDAAEFLLFQYNELIPILGKAKNNASISSMKALVGGDGIFDGQVIVDDTIQTLTEAQNRAQSQVDKYSNTIVNISFTTDKHGLSAGQNINITDSTTGRDIDDAYLIQRVTRSIRAGDYSTYSVKCASTVFGIVELFQKLLDQATIGSVNENEVIENIELVSENISITDSVSYSLNEPNRTWGPDVDQGTWDLFEWADDPIPVVDTRITEDGDTRVTEDGDTRVTE